MQTPVCLQAIHPGSIMSDGRDVTNQFTAGGGFINLEQQIPNFGDGFGGGMGGSSKGMKMGGQTAYPNQNVLSSYMMGWG